MVPKKVLKFARKNGYHGAAYLGEYKGYKCYEPTFDEEGKDVHFVGLPLVIMAKGNEIRLSDNDESMELLELGEND